MGVVERLEMEAAAAASSPEGLAAVIRSIGLAEEAIEEYRAVLKQRWVDRCTLTHCYYPHLHGTNSLGNSQEDRELKRFMIQEARRLETSLNSSKAKLCELRKSIPFVISSRLDKEHAHESSVNRMTNTNRPKKYEQANVRRARIIAMAEELLSPNSPAVDRLSITPEERRWAQVGDQVRKLKVW